MKVLIPAFALLALGCASSPKATQDTPQVKEPPKHGTGPPLKPSVQRKHPLSEMKRVELKVGKKKVMAYVADDESKTREGLMFIMDDELGADEGMIFIFPDQSIRSFWMKNTLIPLDVAFLDESGRILNVITMQPLDEQTVNRSAGPAKYALEMKAGWFERNAVKPGARVDLTSIH